MVVGFSGAPSVDTSDRGRCLHEAQRGHHIDVVTKFCKKRSTVHVLLVALEKLIRIA
jgi:hypothetical protein